MTTLGWTCHTRAAPSWHVQPPVIIFPCRTHYRPSSVKCAVCAHLALVKYTHAHMALVIYTRAHLALVKYTCPSHKAPPVFDWYQFLLLGGKGMCVINFPKVITWQQNGQESNPQPLNCKSNTVTRTPKGDTLWHSNKWQINNLLLSSLSLLLSRQSSSSSSSSSSMWLTLCRTSPRPMTVSLRLRRKASCASRVWVNGLESLSSASGYCIAMRFWKNSNTYNTPPMQC